MVGKNFQKPAFPGMNPQITIGFMTKGSPSSDRRNLTDLVSTPYTRIRYAGGRDDHLIISFASIGRRRAEMPPDEFAGTLLRSGTHHSLFISDLRRSWMNDPHYLKSVQTAVNKLREKAKIKRITTLGLSMGAYSALVASALFPVTTAIALSPQFTMSKEHMPGEKRWQYWRKNIRTFRFETADDAPNPERAFVFHGLENDLQQMRAFAIKPNRDHFVFPDVSHSELGQHFKSQGALSELVTACASHDRKGVARLVGGCGGTWRGRFEKRLADQDQTFAA